MNLKKFLTQVATAAALTATAIAAQAATYQFKLTGDYTATWLLPSNPVPDDSANGIGFVVWDVDGFPDAALEVVDIFFWDASFGGGLQIDDYYGGTVLASTEGPQLYTGTHDNPVFKLGTFSLTEYQGSGTYSLTITDITPVPEPASVGLMLGGLGLVAAAARRRKAEATEAA
jgi:hypothetical protein